MLFFLFCTGQSQITVFWEVGRAQATSAFIVMTSCNTPPCDQEINKSITSVDVACGLDVVGANVYLMD
jgi:hypothetical protein